MKKFEDYVALSTTMDEQSGNRKEILEDMDKMFALKPDNLPSADWIKPMASPDFRNACISGARMISATDPKWSVTLEAEQEEQANKLELFAQHAWTGAGLVSRKPIHFTAALSAMLYGEIHIRAKLVSDMLKVSPSPARTLRLNQIAMRTPVLFDVVNPKLCKVMKDDTGLTAHRTKRKMMVSEVYEMSKEAMQQLGTRTKTEQITVIEIFDEEQHVLWVEGQSAPLLMLPVPGGIIPVAYADVEGSELFNLDTDVDSCQPFGYGVNKSGFWDAQNLMDTLGFSIFYAIGANPLFTADTDPGQQITIDSSVPGGIIVGAKNLRQLFTQVFTGDMQNLTALADRKVTESTLYRTAMGDSPGSGSSYSLAALLSANGRQALIPYERMTEHVCTMIMTTAAQMVKQSGGVSLKTKDGKEELKAEDIPDNLLIEAKLEIDLPIDESKNMQMALQATAGDHPFMAMATAREKWGGIGQSVEEDKRIIAERYAWNKMNITMQAKAQSELQKITMQNQLPQNQPPQGTTPPQQVPPGISQPPGQELSPDMMALQGQQNMDQQMGQPIPPEQLLGMGG